MTDRPSKENGAERQNTDLGLYETGVCSRDALDTFRQEATAERDFGRIHSVGELSDGEI